MELRRRSGWIWILCVCVLFGYLTMFVACQCDPQSGQQENSSKTENLDQTERISGDESQTAQQETHPDGGEHQAVSEQPPESSESTSHDTRVSDQQLQEQTDREDIREEAQENTGKPTAAVKVTPERIPFKDNHTSVVTLDASGSQGQGLQFQWHIPEARLASGQSLTSPTVRVTLSGDGDVSWSLRVYNTAGEDSSAGIIRVNRLPVADIASPKFIELGQQATLSGQASIDPDNDPLTYQWSLVTTPPGSQASITNDTNVQASLRPDVAGLYVIRLTVRDAIQEGHAITAQLLATAQDTTRPSIKLTISPQSGPPNTVFSICTQITDDSPIASQQITVDGTPLQVSSGCGTWTGTQIGKFVVQADATDIAGNTGQAIDSLFVTSPTKNAAPKVSLTEPKHGTLLSDVTNVVGEVSDTDLVHFEIQLTPKGSSTAFVVGTGKSAQKGTLTQLHPSLYPAGLYSLRLCAEDAWAQRTCSSPVTVEIDRVTPAGGVTFLAFLDLQTDLLNVPITVRRIYDSRRLTPSDFGFGWSLEVEGGGSITELNLATAGWEDTGCSKLPYRPNVQETLPHRWTITLARSVHRFVMKLTPKRCATGTAEVDAAFVALPGTIGTLEARNVSLTNLVIQSGFDGLYDAQLKPLILRDFRLTLPDTTRYDLTLAQGITSVRDSGGRVISFSSTGITYSNQGIQFRRDSAGRVTEIEIPGNKKRTYTYSKDGDLIASTDFDNVTTRYRYDANHRLIQILDPRGFVPGTLEYNAQGQIVAVIDAQGNRITLSHNTGKTTAITDRNGHTTLYAYDKFGNVIEVVDPLGNKTLYSYDTQNRLSKMTDALGKIWSFQFNTSGQLISFADPLGNTRRWTYDTSGRLLTSVDAEGGTTTRTYDASGRLATLQAPTGETTTWVYNASGQLTSIQYPSGGKLTAQRDGKGNVTGYTLPNGHTGKLTTDAYGNLLTESYSLSGQQVSYQYSYDAKGRPTQVTLPTGIISKLAYDSSDRPVSATFPGNLSQQVVWGADNRVASYRDINGTTSSLVRDREGRVTSIAFPHGHALTRKLDPLGRPVELSLAGSGIQQVIYNPVGRRSSETHPIYGTTKYTYDDAGRCTQQTDALGSSTTHGYDRAGRRVWTRNALGHTTRFTYDAAGRLTSTQHPDGTQQSITYDKAGQLASISNERKETFQYTRDTAGQLASVTTPAGEQTTFTYHPLGGLKTATLPGGSVWSFDTDNLGRLTRLTPPWGNPSTYNYNPSGLMTQSTDATGNSIQYSYHPTGVLLQMQGSDGQKLTYQRHTDGRVLVVSGSWGKTSYTYDTIGRITRIESPKGAYVAYTYDLQGRRSSISTASGTTSYTYDNTGRLLSASDTQLGQTTYQRDTTGRIINIQHPDGTRTSLTRDTRGRVIQRSVQSSTNSVLFSDSYKRNQVGNIEEIDRGSDKITYTYDNVGRIAKEQRPGISSAIVYSYEKDGSLAQIGTRSFTHNQKLQPTSDGTYTYTYDLAGRLSTRTGTGESTTYTYDSFGRLTKVVRSGTQPLTTTLEYGPSGLLYRITSGSQTRVLLWNLDSSVPELLEERDANGKLLARYVHAMLPLGQIDGTGQTSLFHTSHRGSIQIITQKGTVASRYSYLAYGETDEGKSDLSLRLRFAGEYFIPEIGLYFLRTRMYDPVLGRFLTPDSRLPQAELPGTFNPYVYAANNPVRFRDPLGTFTLGELATVTGIILSLVGNVLPLDRFISSIARTLGLGVLFESAEEQVGISLALAFTHSAWSFLTGGFQFDFLSGATHSTFVAAVFFGGQINGGKVPFQDGGLGPIDFSFWVGPIMGAKNEADPQAPADGFYVTISGSWASRILHTFTSGSSRAWTGEQWVRGSAAVQWEVNFLKPLGFGITGFGEPSSTSIGSSPQGKSWTAAFTLYFANTDPLNIGGIFMSPERAAKGINHAPQVGLALVYYIPVWWVTAPVTVSDIVDRLLAAPGKLF